MLRSVPLIAGEFLIDSNFWKHPTLKLAPQIYRCGGTSGNFSYENLHHMANTAVERIAGLGLQYVHGKDTGTLGHSIHSTGLQHTWT